MSIQQELITYYHLLRRYGINDSHSGNASVRGGEQVWVTPTGANADTLTTEQLVQCDLQGQQTEGASLDTQLHLAVYQHNPTAQCVLHSHGPYTLAMTMDGKDFHPIDFEGQYYFGVVPVLNIAYGDYLDASPQQVAKTLAQHKICVVQGHGIYTQADSLNLAYKWTCTLEHVAKVAYLTEQRAKPS